MVTESSKHLNVAVEDTYHCITTRNNPWGDSLVSNTEELPLQFEDSFSDSVSAQKQDQGKSYIPLDDSEQYLAGLEKKLARLQGKTQSYRENERKKLINALAKSKDDHTIDLLNTANENSNPFIETSDTSQNTTKGLSAVNPQGTLGLVMRKCVPSQVALSTEELCELLKTDILAKVHDEIEADTSKEDPPTQDDKEC